MEGTEVTEGMGFKGSQRIGTNVTERLDLSAKLERLKRGLKADTVPLKSRQYPSIKGSQLSYGLKSGRFGAYDPLRRRGKEFKQAVARYAPPYYFWHKEFINSRKLKPVSPPDLTGVQQKDPDSNGQVICVWCQRTIRLTEYEVHKTQRCKQRLDFLGFGYYRCSSCKQGFIDDQKAKNHVLLHFPALYNDGNKPSVPKKLSIICRDHSKRKKWL